MAGKALIVSDEIYHGLAYAGRACSALEVLEEVGVALTPGVDFDPGGQGYIRISYASSLEDIDEGLTRLGAFLARRETA